ncbi:Uncharacterized protein OBRU01_10131 [Operophtera brumata]|uniref:Small RNA 2'-O-methyltransferase n=1 Tax=Operophtera brumata TaxID=104452 RepID=A0A0L7LEI7_OPEBR|nr:Uncharacterized protein OBRU01_10131 [Operophtera brumata]
MIITLQTLMFFRETLLKALDSILRPYYNKFALTFGRNGDVSDEELDEQVFAEFDEEKGVVFYPPVYLQRYAAVSDCLMDERWSGKLEKVVDLGYHDMSFIKYLKEVSGIQCILGVDIESIPLRCSSDLIGCDDYGPKREKPLQVTLFQGNAADPDYRLIGCDAVVAIEMIEHMLPQDLDRLIHTVVESYTELYSEKQSCVTILITTQSNQKSEYTIDTESLLRSTATRLAAFEQHDKTSQCNLDVEAGKNYMMFDYEEMCYDVVVPRRKIDNRVYMIEDVNSRLNCSTLQINKFSKTSQNLIAKNKVDSLVHTREVIDEIRHLTKMLNFNRSGINQSIENGVHIWHNINWGDNAPYWNQYYKLVREYNPPHEFDDDEGSVELSRLEIPMERLMRWDGYQIVDNMVIHSRLVVDNASTLGTQEDDWPDDAVSEVKKYY